MGQGKAARGPTEHNLGVPPPQPTAAPTLPSMTLQLSLLSCGAEGHGNDRLTVTLQGAGAAGHSSNPEDSLWLVNDVQDLLCLHRLGLQRPPQRGDDLGIMDIESQWQGILLEDNSKGNTPIKGQAGQPPQGDPPLPTFCKLCAGKAFFSATLLGTPPLFPTEQDIFSPSRSTPEYLQITLESFICISQLP